MTRVMHAGIATVSLLFSVVAIYIWNYTHWTRRKIRQGYQVPLFGDNLRHFFGFTAFQNILQSIYYKFPDARYSGFYQYLQPGLIIRDPELIKKISTGDKEYFLDRTPFLSETSDVLWNKNLFALQGEKWREMRNTLTPSFTSSKMKQMFITIVDKAQEFTNTLKDREGQMLEVEFKDLSSRFTNDVIALTAFGLEVDSLSDPENEFFVKGRATTDCYDYWKLMKMKLTLIWPSLGRVLKTNVFDKDISDFFRSVIKKTVDYRREKNERRNDMLQLLMEAHQEDPERDDGIRREIPLDHDDITAQALIFFLGGFETVSSSISFMAYELAINPDIQKRLIEEIDGYRQKHAEPKYEHICHMLYLDMILAEVFRKWPPILNLDRICTHDYVIEAELPSERKLTIEKGSLIWMPIWCIHHDPKHYPEPDKFNPERFSPSNKPSTKDGKYIPFGLGGRSCIGSRFAIMQIKIFFFELMQRFRIVTIPQSRVPFVPVKHTFNLASQYGFWFGLQKRSDDERSNYAVVDEMTHNEKDEDESTVNGENNKDNKINNEANEVKKSINGTDKDKKITNGKDKDENITNGITKDKKNENGMDKDKKVGNGRDKDEKKENGRDKLEKVEVTEEKVVKKCCKKRGG